MRVLSLSKTVNMLFIAPGDSLLRREARHYDAMSEYQIFNKRHTQKGTVPFQWCLYSALVTYRILS